jgi:hypothetical protein
MTNRCAGFYVVYTARAEVIRSRWPFRHFLKSRDGGRNPQNPPGKGDPGRSPNEAALARFGVPVTDTRPTLSLVDTRGLSSHALLGGEQNE